MRNPINYNELTKRYTILLSFYGIEYFKQFKTKNDAIEFIQNTPSRLISDLTYDFSKSSVLDPLPEVAELESVPESETKLELIKVSVWERFKKASQTSRVLIVVPIFWAMAVSFFVILFEPYGDMSSSDYSHLAKVIIFPPVLFLLAYFMYIKLIIIDSSRGNDEI